MSKKDYILTAKIIKELLSETSLFFTNSQKQAIVNKFSAIFKLYNKRFDIKKFEDYINI